MAEIEHHDVGDLVPLRAAFTNAAGAATNPATVTFRVARPNGTVTSYVYGTDAALVRESPGNYLVEVLADEAGYWQYRFEGTGAVAQSEDGLFVVDPSVFVDGGGLSPRALCTLTDVKVFSDADQSDNSRDWLLVRLVNAASTVIHSEARREFKAAGTNPQTRVFDLAAADVRERLVAVGDLAAFTSGRLLDPDGALIQAVAGSDIVSLPRVRNEWQPITRLRLRSAARLATGYALEVTGNWGFPAVPEDIRQAAVTTVSIWAARDLGTFSDIFVQEEGRVELARELPRQVLQTVQRYRPPRPALTSIPMQLPRV